jgi:hypothetical protein
LYLHSWRIAPCEVLAGLITGHDTPPLKSRHHPNSRIAQASLHGFYGIFIYQVFEDSRRWRRGSPCR